MNVRQPKSTLKAIDLRRVAMLEKEGRQVQAAIWGLAEAHVQEEEGYDCPSGKVDSDCGNLLSGISRGSIGSTNTSAGDQEAGKGKPEGAVRRECCLRVVRRY